MGAALQGVSASISHLGAVRRCNEDACLELPNKGLWVVADGMGGHQAGGYASRMIVEELSEVGSHRCLSEFVDEIEHRLLSVNDRLAEMVMHLPAGTVIGSTVVALLALHRQAACIWAGDSRLYRWRDGVLRLLTRDHSEVEELVAQGQITPPESVHHPSANVITRAIGALHEQQTVEIRIYELRAGDRYLLCTDGLHRVIGYNEIMQLMAGGEPIEVCERLINLALARACTDNVTVVTVEFQEPAG